MKLQDIVTFLDRPEITWSDVRDSTKLPWDITPTEYIEFSQLDIGGTDKRSIINALSNAKRALECQLDSLMLTFGFGSVSDRWNVPKKLEVLKDIGIIAPRILAKINRHRNDMEHEYTCPKHDVVADFVDVVALFLQATRVHIYDRQCELEFWDEVGAELDVSWITGGLRVTPAGALKNETPLEILATDEMDYRCLLGAIIRCVGPR